MTARRLAQGALLAAPVGFLAVVGWTHRWMTDDGFIYLRVVQQIQDGNGPVFNAGERVEVYTGTLWVAVLTAADVLLPLRSEWVAVLAGLVLSVAGLVLAMVGAARLWPAPGPDGDDGAGDGLEPRPWLVPAGALVFVAIFPVWAFATSGLENGLAFAWIGGCTLALAGWARHPERPLRLRAAVLLGLGPLVRPELVLLSAAVLVAVALADRHDLGWRGLLRTAAAAIALPVAYQLFRMGYFGSIVPNTGIAKEGSRLNVERGWRYFRDFADPYLLVVPGALLAAGAYIPYLRRTVATRDHRRTAAMLGMVIGAALCVAYVIAIGGDYHHGRLLLPGLLAALAPVAVVPVSLRRRAAGPALTAVSMAGVALWSAVAATSLRPLQFDELLANGTDIPRSYGQVTSEDAGAPFFLPLLLRQAQANEVLREVTITDWQPPNFEVDPSLGRPYAALWLVGVFGYALGTDTHVLDMYGLADTFTAHLELGPPTGEIFPVAGHEKPLPFVWLAALMSTPDAEVDPGQPAPALYELLAPTTGDAFVEQLAWARATLRCPPIVELFEAARAPLTPGRVLDNLVGSVDNARLRIPPDPEEAYRRFCGAGIPGEVTDVRERLSGD